MKCIISLTCILFAISCPHAYSVIFKYWRNIVHVLISHYLLSTAFSSWTTERKIIECQWSVSYIGTYQCIVTKLFTVPRIEIYFSFCISKYSSFLKHFK
jgi:hypothetical protein